jgi:hypothetical protein
MRIIDPEISYLPILQHLFGFGSDYIIWGRGIGEIGVVFVLFLFSLLLYFQLRKKNEAIKFYFFASVFLLLLTILFIPLGQSGIESIRFLPPACIVMCIFVALTFDRIKLPQASSILLFTILLFGLFQNAKIIQENYEIHNYGKARYEIFQKINENFSFEKDFTNYRFGAYSFAFAENLNYFFPGQSQTFGYYIQGALYPEILKWARETIWESFNENETKFLLNWFGIKYFEIDSESLNFKSKFENDQDFVKIVSNKVGKFNYEIYEYKNAQPIVSLIRGKIISTSEPILPTLKKLASQNSEIIPLFTEEKIVLQMNRSELKFELERKSPDIIKIKFDSIQKGDAVLVKEHYYPAWKAFEYPSKRELKIYRAGPNFMLVFPSEKSTMVIFEYQATIYDYVGIVFTLVGIICLLYLACQKNEMKTFKYSEH